MEFNDHTWIIVDKDDGRKISILDAVNGKKLLEFCKDFRNIAEFIVMEHNQHVNKTEPTGDAGGGEER